MPQKLEILTETKFFHTFFLRLFFSDSALLSLVHSSYQEVCLFAQYAQCVCVFVLFGSLLSVTHVEINLGDKNLRY